MQKCRKIIIFCFNVEAHRNVKDLYPDLIYYVTSNQSDIVPCLNEIIDALQPK